MTELEFVTIDQIQDREKWEYRFIGNSHPLSGFVQGNEPQIVVDTFDEEKVTLTRSSMSPGRLNDATFRVARDLKALANIVQNISSGAGGMSKAFVNVSSNDNDAGHLIDKVVGGSGVYIEEMNDGDNEQLQIKTSSLRHMFFASLG